MARIYVTRGDAAIVVSRRRPRAFPGRPVRRTWNALVEFPGRSRLPRNTFLIFAPPAALGYVVATLAPPEIGIAVGGASLVATTYLAPAARRKVGAWLTARRLRRSEYAFLTGPFEQEFFDRSIRAADRISQTWPDLGPLVDSADAELLLARALWEIAEVLARRQELDAVVTDLERADFGRPRTAGADAEESGSRRALGPGPHGVDDQDARLAGELRSRLAESKAEAKAARSQIDADLARREAGLRRAEQAGLDFIREQEMRRAIREAGRTLGATRPGVPASPDAATDLADRTRAVVDAYRELTTDPATT